MSERERPERRSERRWFPRHDLTLPILARALGGGDDVLPLELRGLSLDGAFVHSELLLEVGDEVELELPLPSSSPSPSGAGPSVVRARGLVVRVAAEAGGMGLRLSHLSAADRKTLLHFLSVAH